MIDVPRKEFRESDREKVLLWCDRHCCLCGKQCGGNIEIHHIDKEDDNNISNAIPLCFECHGQIHAYKNTPKGAKFKSGELRKRRDQIYSKHTAYLVPIVNFWVEANKNNLTDVLFRIQHGGGPYPVKALVTVKVFSGKRIIKDFSKQKDFYGGNKYWHLNPGITIRGHFGITRNSVNSKDLRIIIETTIIDKYDCEHKLLPMEYKFAKGENSFWFLEPGTLVR